jgi:hypothetical protein
MIPFIVALLVWLHQPMPPPRPPPELPLCTNCCPPESCTIIVQRSTASPQGPNPPVWPVNDPLPESETP